MNRALQEITNIQNTRIKVTIKKEEKPMRREILSPFLEYTESFYKHLDNKISQNSNLRDRYTGKVTEEMRKVLIEWMYDVKTSCFFSSSTFEMAVRLVDTYALKHRLKKKSFQLLGCTAMFISHKHLEHKRYKLSSWVDLCDGAYTQDDLLAMERSILRTVDFSVIFLLPMQIIQIDHGTIGNALCTYFSELILLQMDYASITPSSLASFIEESTISILSKRTPSNRTLTLLKCNTSILEHQPRAIKNLINAQLT
ncbi:G2/mitotic-specific cyclin-B1 [Nematocida sp. LUAm3]|nr:G2/mitotic-specific cyclin-B1 [Nematocida sp. LUAm3]KAI5175655.1 G2/mitotic-specific cyclin-B1 [Nematocida sp. LUAm2]KAI5178561.1 G2/mitotic-specific cyclin-B1 [Nematocida sp. LUAm1]